MRKVLALLISLLIPATSHGAFASAGTFTSRADKSSTSASWTTITEAGISSGDLLLMVVASENRSTSNNTGTTDHSTVSVGGQAMTKADEWNESGGSAADGSTVSVWYLQNSTACAANSPVVINWSGTLTAKACAGWRFTMNNANTFTAVGSNAHSVQTSGVDPASMTLSSLPSREYIFLRGIAARTQNTGFTNTTNYTPFDTTGAATAGGGAGQGVRGEFRIVTATGETSDPTWTAVVNSNIFAAFYELVSGGGAPRRIISVQ